jgi:(S)-ureidoglycine aminohydrolase
MEHGLYMLAGQGVYRLGERWYPVMSGDAIWMSPYLTQWFAATGKSSTRYIYYKEMNRVAAV